MAGITGKEERAWVMGQLKQLCGGMVWKTQVPDHVDLERMTDGGLNPYIIVRFARPSAVSVGRNIGSGEQGQPHMLTWSVQVIGSDADELEAVMDEVESMLVGEQPSPTASEIKARGGFAYPFGDSSSRPSRHVLPAFMRCYINV